MHRAEPSEGSPRLVFATRNEGKVVELVELLRDTSWEVTRLPDDVPEYEEVGETFADNARGKALHAAAHVPVPVLADDSGLEVDALGGEPGVRSARYIDPTMTPVERNRALLDRLREVPDGKRGARFVCHLVLAHGDGIIHETTGVCAGTIAWKPRGDGGFGYDPIFRIDDLDATFAEISREEKSARSHRGRAVRDMVRFLTAWRPR